MDWIRNNRFLASLLGALFLGVAVFGYLLYSGYSNYTEVSERYDKQVNELGRLKNLEVFPKPENVEKYEEEKKAYLAAVGALQAKLAKMEPEPEKPLSPSDFQSRLRDAVAEVRRSADTAGVALPPEGFYLGFETYRDQLPDAAAVPLLTAQLKSIQQLMNFLVQQKIDKLAFIKRAPLPQEGAAATTASAQPRPGAKPPAEAAEVITRQVIEIGFSSEPSSFRETLNKITEASPLYIVRALQVKNQAPTSPPRDQGLTADTGAAGTTPGAGMAAAAPPATKPPVAGGGPTRPPGPGGVPEPPLPEAGAPLKYIVGQEKLDIIARIELTKVAPPRG